MATKVTAHITGTIWKIEKKPGDKIAEGESIIIIESMKMEMPVESPVSGTVREIACVEGQSVEEGVVLAVID